MRIAPFGRRYSIDFAASRPALPPVSWWLLAAGCTALVVALADALPRWSLQSRLRTELEHLRSTASDLPSAARAGGHPANAESLAQALALVDQLDRPWPQLLGRLETTRVPGVHLVQVGVDARFQSLQLLAEASRLDDVLSYARALAGQGPVKAVRLTHHEWRNVPGARIVVASLSADLAPDAPAPPAAAEGSP